MIVDDKIIFKDDLTTDISFTTENCLVNNIWLSIINSGIEKVKKLSDQNLLLIKNLVENSLKWIVDNKRATKIDVIIEQNGYYRVNIGVICKINEETIKYEYYYSF